MSSEIGDYNHTDILDEALTEAIKRRDYLVSRVEALNRTIDALAALLNPIASPKPQKRRPRQEVRKM